VSGRTIKVIRIGTRGIEIASNGTKGTTRTTVTLTAIATKGTSGTIGKDTTGSTSGQKSTSRSKPREPEPKNRTSKRPLRALKRSDGPTALTTATGEAEPRTTFATSGRERLLRIGAAAEAGTDTVPSPRTYIDRTKPRARNLNVVHRNALARGRQAVKDRAHRLERTSLPSYNRDPRGRSVTRREDSERQSC
jgi:hypothetical protein